MSAVEKALKEVEFGFSTDNENHSRAWMNTLILELAKSVIALEKAAYND